MEIIVESVKESLPITSLAASGIYSSLLILSYTEGYFILKSTLSSVPPTATASPNNSTSSLSKIATYMSRSLNPILSAHSRYQIARPIFKLPDLSNVHSHDLKVYKYFKRASVARGVIIGSGVIGITCIIAKEYYFRVFRTQSDALQGLIYCPPVEWKDKIYPFRISNRCVSYNSGSNNFNSNSRYILVMHSNQMNNNCKITRNNGNIQNPFMSLDTFSQNFQIAIKDVQSKRRSSTETTPPLLLIEADYCYDSPIVKMQLDDDKQCSEGARRLSKVKLEAYDWEMYQNLKHLLLESKSKESSITNNEVRFSIAHIMNSNAFDCIAAISPESSSNNLKVKPSHVIVSDNFTVYDLRRFVYNEILSQIYDLSSTSQQSSSNKEAASSDISYRKASGTIIATSPADSRSTMTALVRDDPIGDASKEETSSNTADKMKTVETLDDNSNSGSELVSSEVADTTGIDSIGSTIRILTTAAFSVLAKKTNQGFTSAYAGLSSSAAWIYGGLSKASVLSYDFICDKSRIILDLWQYSPDIGRSIYSMGNNSLTYLLKTGSDSYTYLASFGASSVNYLAGIASYSRISLSQARSSIMAATVTKIEPKPKRSAVFIDNSLLMSTQFAGLLEYSIDCLKFESDIELIEVKGQGSADPSNKISDRHPLQSMSPKSIEALIANRRSSDTPPAQSNVVIVSDMFDNVRISSTGYFNYYDQLSRDYSALGVKLIVVSFANQHQLAQSKLQSEMQNVKFINVHDIKERIFLEHSTKKE